MNKKNKIIPVYRIVVAFFLLNALGACKYRSKINKIPVQENQAITIIKKNSIDAILICAHRSFHTEAPENSLESIRKAIKVGIDLVELDVRTTKDSTQVLMHDDSIDRTTTGTGKISDYTYKELQQFNLKMDDSITASRIPLLQDALKLLKKSECIANLDLKAVSYQQLYKLLKDMEMEHRVISFIGKKEKVMEMIGIDSLYGVLPLSKTKEDMIFYKENTKSSLQHFTDESFTTENMKWVHKKGELVFINTLWDEDEDFKMGNVIFMDSIIAFRPAIIQTDYPKKLLNYLRSKGLHD